MQYQYQNLTQDKQTDLLDLLLKFKYLFDGTLKIWNISQVDFELKESSNPVRLQPFLVPRLHEYMFKKNWNIYS